MADRSTSQDRRRWRRHWLRAPVRIVSQEHPIDGFGLRVSEGGIFLFAVADIAPGALVEVEFTKPHSGERSRRWGVVRNRVVYLYGLEFVRDEQPEWVECSAEAART
ncbi:MAG TPA: PilZ domain-containing protein [Terriglobales bacterium]|nr:PilZ domain-containing protein [Terriglobales bacterium]